LRKSIQTLTATASWNEVQSGKFRKNRARDSVRPCGAYIFRNLEKISKIFSFGVHI